MKGEEKMKYVIVRTYSAGVFAGELESKEQARGCFTKRATNLLLVGGGDLISAHDGRNKDQPIANFPVPLIRVELLQAIEILDVTSRPESIMGVPVWQK